MSMSPEPPPVTELVTLATFAKSENLTPRHVRRLIEDGLPVVKTRRGPRIRPSAGRAWIEAARRARAEAPTITDARRVVILERARGLKLKNDSLAGRLIDAQDAERRWTAHVVEARNALLGIPSKAKQRIPSLTTADVATLDTLIRESLEALADGRAPKESAR